MKNLVVAVAVLAAASAFGQLSSQYADWAGGPVQHLMTKQETKQWTVIRSDADARAFIDLFWARRDPTPDTPRNEFHEEFDKRVAVADEYFTSARTRGAMSDPGKVLILLGPPYRISGRAGAPAVSSLGGMTVPTDSEGGILVPRSHAEENRQVWTYAHEHKPKYIKQSDFVLVFLDAGKNEWQLAYTERTNPRAILLEAVNGLIISPKLEKAPFSSFSEVRATSFRDLLLETAYKKFRGGELPQVGPAKLTWGEFISPEGQLYASVQLYVPEGGDIAAGRKVTFFGAVEDAAGKIVEVVEDSVTMEANGEDAWAQKSLLFDPGTYTATFGLADGGTVLSALRTQMTIDPLDPAAPAISDLFLSNNIHPLKTDWSTTDPFTFGGLKVIPKGDLRFVPKGDLWYFAELRNPGVDEKGAPNVRVNVDIQGKTPKGPVELKLPMQQAEMAPLAGEKNRYALGLAIPLEGFMPGDYIIKVHVVDAVLGKNYDLEREFRVQGL